ncbi:MAG: UPF0182 family protein, partial [Caldilineaceae bacterium]|nr:UPF0182 family protein [Caldilineaceae bacterium]
MPSRWWWLLVLPFVVLLLFNTVTGFFADWAWYDSLGFASVMWTRIGASWGLFLGGVAVAWLVLAGNIWIAQRTSPLGLAATPLDQFAESTGVRVPVALLAISGVFALFMGLNVVGDWSELLLFLNQRPFNVNDPIFGRDVSFYLFTLPILELVRGWLLALFLASLVGVTVVTGTGWRGWQVRTPVLLHMAILGALILALLAFGYQLEAAKLVYSDRGAVFGAGYTDVHAQLPAYNILTVVTLITAVLLIVTVFMRRAWRAIVVVLLVWLGVAVVAGSVYPGIVQRFQVNPNELSLERPYIEDNIRFTRVAYGLEDIDARNYDASQQLTSESLQKEPDTVRNIRLWDYRPLLETYNQVQALRQYYAFNDVDIDRYEIDGTRRQVTLSARELVADRLNTEAQTWVNRKLVYTHGYGVAASPVEQITADGLPMFYLKDLPTQGVFKIEVPQIYFGELANDYVIAGTRMAEFDYPSGSGNVTTNFTADTGIDMSFWHRALFALRFADINLVLNQDMTSESQLLWRRNIVSRARLLAPFFEYDHDPYIVIGDDGRLYWFIDGYAISDRYPYSEPYAGRFNYIRNAVKVVIDAYDGSMVFYVVDENEPITAAYQRIFPVLFRPLSEMPDYLLKHVRYPTDLFAVQAELYRTYHMTDATEFYNKEDMWAWPEEIFYSQPQPIEPYYVLMQLPDSDDLDYVQILPFTPANRENMIAWMAAHSDPEKYGQIVVYEFGKEALFFGPKQIEARVDQDPTISAQLSLWN